MIGLLLISLTVNAWGFFSHEANEYELSYSGELLVSKRDLDFLPKANGLVNEQVWYLMGGLANGSFKGIPKSNQSISNIKVAESEDPQKLRVTYDYKSGALIDKNATSEVTFPLPLDPLNVFKAAKSGWGINSCVDSSYNTEYYFFYFWNPFRSSCSLKEGRDFKIFKGSLAKKPSTIKTYPEYPRLVDANKNITIDLFFGMDKVGGPRTPEESNDVNAPVYLKVREFLLKNGYYSRVWTDKEIVRVSQYPVTNIPYIEEFTKGFSSEKLRQVKVRMYFGSSELKRDSEVFHYLMKDSFENSSVIIYAGHSGLGSSIGIDDIGRYRGFRMMPALDRYQIMFYHSCSSYFYYNDYLRMQKVSTKDPQGTKNLDILNNGLTFFNNGSTNLLPLLGAIDLWGSSGKRLSYQEILAKGAKNTFFSVNGDEDNPIQ